jgi:PIN domain nuclease of toxin-antitoxin system
VKLLLDTHIWVWTLLEPKRLGPNLAATLRDEHNELWLSPISVWELILLVEKGRVVLDREPGRWIAEAWRSVPVRDAVLTREVALESRVVRVPHADPADRFIAATAAVYDLTLATADRRLLDIDDIHTLANS